MLDQERLKQILTYNSETGEFRWKLRTDVPKQWNTLYAGKPAGWTTMWGYICISIDYRTYRANRLAFLYMKGRWPDPECDHKDLNRANNRWTNLREATRSQQSANTSLRATNSSGVTGVSWSKRRNKWEVYINYDKEKRIKLGFFSNLDEAAAIRSAAEAKYFGEFARSA